MKTLLQFIILIFALPIFAQIGINTDTPNASLEIKTLDESNPNNNEGILVPQMDVFPSTNPTASQDGMLVFITGNNSQAKGFYYWDNAGATWEPMVSMVSSGIEELDDLVDAKSDGSSIFLGAGSGANNTGNNNVALGIETLQANTTGFFNVATGHRALYSNTTGFHNVASGFTAMINNTAGSKNTALGFNALRANISGNNNNAIGSSALVNNTIGNHNIAIGTNTLRSNTDGENNIAQGNEALYSNLSGDNNLSIGIQSLYSNTTGYNNIGLGTQSLYGNTDGYNNIAFGTNALTENISGFENISIGRNALHETKTGNNNIAIGTDALYFNVTTGNIGIGSNALRQLSDGFQNIAIGDGAGFNMFGGSNNIIIGQSAEPPSNVGNNQVRIGNKLITYAGIQVPWTVTSDAQFKENIQEIESGLTFISQLKPVNYIRKNDSNQRKEFGFIAQDVENVLEDLELVNYGILNKDDDGFRSLRYNDFIPLLTKAIQEQQNQIDDLKQLVADLINNHK